MYKRRVSKCRHVIEDTRIHVVLVCGYNTLLTLECSFWKSTSISNPLMRFKLRNNKKKKKKKSTMTLDCSSFYNLYGYLTRTINYVDNHKIHFQLLIYKLEIKREWILKLLNFFLCTIFISKLMTFILSCIFVFGNKRST